MAKTQTYENFPIGIPLFAIVLTYFAYLVGAYIIAGFGLIFAFLFLLYCFGIELYVILRSCKDCYYYGKVCGLGKGWVAPWFCKKGDPEKFADRSISFYDLIPDFLVGIIPIVAGIILLVQNFSLIILGLIILLFFLFFSGTALIRGKLVCKFCKQKEIGCPAEKLFNKK